jgi:hypothetical protein
MEMAGSNPGHFVNGLIVIARSAATKQSSLLCRAMDCFAALAMTADGFEPRYSPSFIFILRRPSGVRRYDPGI